jgi:hypothetical protein
LNFFVFKIYAPHFFLVTNLGATGADLTTGLLGAGCFWTAGRTTWLAHFWQGGAGLLTTNFRAPPLLLKTLGNWFKFGLQTFLPHLFPRWRWRCLLIILWAKDWLALELSLAELESMMTIWLVASDPSPFEDDEDWLPDEPKNSKIKLSILQNL